MKRTLLLVLLAAIAFSTITSCSKDDDPKIDPIVGEWIADKVTVSGLPEKYDSYEGSLLPEVFGIIKYSFNFKSDKTFDIEIRQSNGVILEGSGSWVGNGETYTLSSDTGSDSFTLNLRDNKLSLVEEGVTLDLEDPDDETVVEEVTATFTYVFNKSK